MESRATNSAMVNTNYNPMRVDSPGTYFQPTENNLIGFYLKRKVMSRPLPGNFVPEVNVYESDPWDLPGEPEEERYFFSPLKAKYPYRSKANRATNSGYWRGSGKERRIVVINEGEEIVGYFKRLGFYAGKYNDNTKTPWIMHEYRLDDASANWVLCKVFKKKEKAPASSSTHLNEDAIME